MLSPNVPKGIYNVGNTCYVNTLLQCLGMCPAFRDMIFVIDYEQLADRRQCDKGRLMSYQLSEVYDAIWKSNATFNPRECMKTIHMCLSPSMFLFEQNDICEFFSIFMDKLCTELGAQLSMADIEYLNSIIQGRPCNTPYDAQKQKMDMHWVNEHKKDFSKMKELLCGQTITQIICNKCMKIHHTYEIYMNIMLGIDACASASSSSDMRDLLRQYFKDEMINDHEKTWTCDGCNTKSQACKTTRHWRNPRILVITLKRFNMNLEKVNTDVMVPHILDMSEYTLGLSHTHYVLKAVAYHSGSFSSGHYFAVICGDNDAWYIVDDESIMQISNYEEALKKGYMYFYEACEDAPASVSGVDATPTPSRL